MNPASAFPAACCGVSEQKNKNSAWIGESSRFNARFFNRGILIRGKIIRAHLFTTLFLLLLGIEADSQKYFNFFYGKVYDKVKKTEIPNVNFSFIGSRLGAISDRKGEFSFFIDTLPVTMLVSHVGYITKKVLLDTTSYSLTLYLEPHITELREVEIRASIYEPFFKDNKFAVKDYEIDSGNIYLLIYRFYLSKAEIICKSQLGDTLAKSDFLSFSGKNLIKDCLGYLHIFNNDSIYQIYRKENKIQLIHPESKEKYDKVLNDCLASTSEILFFRKQTDLGTGMEYFGINRKNKEWLSLSTVRDEGKAKMLRRNSDDLFLLLSGIPDGRENFANWNYVHKILYRPIKSSLYKIGSFICIFNIPEKHIEFYDQKGAYSYKLALKLDVNIEGRWSEEIIVDEILGKAYTTFIKNGTFILYGINLNTGILKKTLSLYHPYPEKIKIFSGFVYYLYDVPGSADNKILFRQRL